MSLHLSRSLGDAIRDLGSSVYPSECCGFLVGRAQGSSRWISQIWPAVNEKEKQEARRRYWISPETYFRNELRARREGMEIVGVYHSHPDHPDRPSEFDRQHALPGWSYVIFSVAQGHAGPLRSWRLVEDRSTFDAEEIVSHDDDVSF